MPRKIKVLNKQAARTMSHIKVSEASKNVDDRYNTGYKTGSEARHVVLPKVRKRK